MGKGKNKLNEQNQQHEGGASSSEENSGQEQKKDEEVNETRSESNKSSYSKGTIVLKVFIHCQGCADTIHNSLRGFEGVEVIDIDSNNHKVTVKGAKADPLKVLERVRKKCRKHVELLYPVLTKNKKEEKKEEKKPKVAEVTLKVNLHCPSCATEVKQRIHKLEGVQTVETDQKNSIVKVMGTMEAEKIVELMKKKEGRHAMVVKQQQKKGENKEEGEQQKGGKKQKDSSSAYPNYPPDLVYASQLFSDENPNACSIM